jgi:formylglycine-generating enzyme required for sulfatase activity
MKHEVSQGQYAEFLNMLTADQAALCYDAANAGVNRYTISGTYPNYAASATNRACNFLNWLDGIRYVRWAGLRPMTELEYEKACRGPLTPVAGEYAWGNTSIAQATGLSNDGTFGEVATPTTANCVYGSAANIGGPIRSGAFATSISGRRDAGASYWGIMELSGNVWERAISVGCTEGRAFTGLHGTGTWASPVGWPTTQVGYGVRGCAWNSASMMFLHVSDRTYANVNNANRSASYGWRGVRTAP